MAADVKLLNSDSQALLDVLHTELQKGNTQVIVVYQSVDGSAHYRRVGFAGAGKFSAIGLLAWAHNRIMGEIEGKA